MQSRRASAVEAVTQAAVGYGLSVALAWWWYGGTVSHAARGSVLFVIASLVRSYGLRRAFARWG